ncbi:MAG TPA: hypothetical protein VFR81_18975 [Longimicrobium sp.]|nr:hypothetical protein [Longimicrobium sp.]
MRTILLLALAATSVARPARAQNDYDDDYKIIERGLTGVAAVPESRVRSMCMDFGTGWLREKPAAERARIETSCRMTETGELARADGERFRFARYRRRITMPPEDARRPRDRRIINEEVVLLLSQPAEGGRLRPVRMWMYGPDFVASVHLRTARAPGGGVLLSVLECVNGTAGCAGQSFMLRRGGRWRPVREAWREQLPASMQRGFWKGTYIDPATLEGGGGLYSDRDGNCCPSRELHVRVRLRGDSLVLRDYRIGKPPGEPE